MVDLPTGLYEELVTRRLARRLHAFDAELIDRAALDSTDAHELLARHVEQLMRRALRAIGSDDPKATARQVELTNEIAQAMPPMHLAQPLRTILSQIPASCFMRSLSTAERLARFAFPLDLRFL